MENITKSIENLNMPNHKTYKGTTNDELEQLRKRLGGE